MQINDLNLMGIEPASLTDDVGEEDAIKLGHSIGLKKLLETLEKEENTEARDRLRLVSMVIEMALRNVYGCPMTVCYWTSFDPEGRTVIVHIKMTNPALQLVSLIGVDLVGKQVNLQRQIARHIYSTRYVVGLAGLIPVVNDGLEWAGVSPNPAMPFFVNRTYNTCVWITGPESLKTFDAKCVTEAFNGGFTPTWARELAEAWKENQANGVFVNYRGDNTLFTRLAPSKLQVTGIYVLDVDPPKKFANGFTDGEVLVDLLHAPGPPQPAKVPKQHKP